MQILSLHIQDCSTAQISIPSIVIRITVVLTQIPTGQSDVRQPLSVPIQTQMFWLLLSRQLHNGGSSSSKTQTISGSEATSHVYTTCPLCWCGLVQVCCSQEPQARAVSLNRLFGFHHPWNNYRHCPCAIFCCNL